VGIGLLMGRSSTQLADFVRRTAELAAIIVSWLVYRALSRERPGDGPRKEKLEKAASLGVGLAMCLGGAAMALLAFFPQNTDKGNVVPGLVIAILGVMTNSWFWLRYRMLDRKDPNAILEVQSRLYRAKSLVDLCVTAALLSVALFPGSRGAYYMDAAGSLVVAVYLILSGAGILRGKAQKPRMAETGP
jgi:divalent metal cation (Fe/Co/Zn/Cd) transporter